MHMEPNPQSFEEFKNNRPDQDLLNVAVCDKESTVHFVVDSHPAVLGIVEFMTESFCRQCHPNLNISTFLRSLVFPCKIC